MKKIFSFFSATNLKINLFNLIKRFPILLLFIIILAVSFLINLHGDFSKIISDSVFKISFSIIVTFFLSLGFYLFSESILLSNIKKNILQLISILFGLIFYIGFKVNLDDFENVIYFILILTGIISLLFFSPYIKKLFYKENIQSIYYSYFYKTSSVFLISTILGGVLFLLGSIGITTIFELFDIKGYMYEKIYGDWAIIALSFITPIFALTQIPVKETFNKSNFIENSFFSFLIKYIAILFIFLYFVILYSYTLKVLINFKDWPKGEVSWMVIGFSIFGYLIYIFSYIFEKNNKFIKFFRNYFPLVVIPQLAMLFYAIYLRIMQYDLTMNRYFVIIFGIWLAVISLYMAISSKKTLAYIPFILTIFTIFISIGPWGVYSLPESRQLTRLENNLVKAGILKNGEIFPLKNYEDINSDLSKDIYNGINYLCSLNDCTSIKILFPKQYSEISNNTLNSYSITSGITEKIKVKSYNGNLFINSILYFQLGKNNALFPLDISGYSKIISISNSNDVTNSEKDYAIINIENNYINIFSPGQISDAINTKEIKDRLLGIYNETGDTTLRRSEMIFDLKGRSGKIYKIMFENISLKNPKYEGNSSNSYYNVRGYILIK